MKDFWLVCGGESEIPDLMHEVRMRGAGERVMRTSSLKNLCEMYESLHESCAGVVFSASNCDVLDLCRVIKRIKKSGRDTRIVVFATNLDADIAARLFKTGAHEVVTVERSAGADSDKADDVEGPLGFDELSAEALDACDDAVETESEGAESDIEAGRMPTPAPVFRAEMEESKSAGSGTVYERNLRFEEHYESGLDEPEWAQASAAARAAAAKGPGAPLVCAISGRGGAGKSTLVASMAVCAELFGMRVSVVDLDLMRGCLHVYLGADEPADITRLLDCPGVEYTEDELLSTSVRVSQGIRLWGGTRYPEQAERMGEAVERLLDVLRCESDLVLVDTSTFWSDAAAAAVSRCDRCLVVGDATPVSAESASQIIGLASRMGLPRTKMTSVVNRFGAGACDEGFAMKYEMACALGSRVRIADAGPDTSSLLSFGRAEELVSKTDAFSKDLRSFTKELLVELGCPVSEYSDLVTTDTGGKRPRIRLPWGR